MRLVVIEFCEAIAARIFRLELLLNFSKRLPIFRYYFTIPSSWQKLLCTVKCVIFPEAQPAPTFELFFILVISYTVSSDSYSRSKNTAVFLYFVDCASRRNAS